MKKIASKIMKINFPKRYKQLIVAVLCVVLLGGGLSAFLLREQIGEVVTSVQAWHENEDSYRTETDNTAADHRDALKEQRHKDDILENIHITEPSTAAKVTVGITGALFVLAAAIYWLLVAAWLYKSAVQSGMNGFLWLLLGLLGNLLTAVLFYLMRSFLRKQCPSCGHYASWEAKYCTQCGAALVEKCAECGELVCAGDRFCPSCGKQMSEH